MPALYSAIVVLILALIAFIGVQVLDLHFLFGVIVPYVTFIILIFGFAYRVFRWAKAPVPFHVITVTGQQKSLPWIKFNAIDSPTSTIGVIGRMALDVLLFRSLFRNEKVELKRNQKLIYSCNKYLWLGSLAFHWSLLIILIRHFRLFIEPVPSIVILMQNFDSIFELPTSALYITDILILIALTFLFLRRVFFYKMRYISLTADYFAVLLLLGIAVSGILVNFFFRVDVAGVKKMAIGFFSFQPVVPEGIGSCFYVHLFLVNTLLAYLPFSKMMHLVGVLLSPTKNLKNDSRMRRHINPWNKPVKTHTYEEYEDEFRESMKGVRLPLDKES